MTNHPPLFCAIDTHDLDHAVRLSTQIASQNIGLKLGLEFFNSFGPSGVEKIRESCPEAPLFLDLKLHDIPNTIAGAVRTLTTNLAPTYLNVHASGGAEMMRAAQNACAGQTKLLAVTILSSLSKMDISDIGYEGDDIAESVKRLAVLTKDAGLAGVVCSGHDYQQCFAMNWAVQQQQTPLLQTLIKGDIDDAEFAAQKQQADLQQHTQANTLCGYVNAKPAVETSQLSFNQAKEILVKGNAYLIDTREPYEHGANNLSVLLNVPIAKTLNIPLSRMAHALTQGQLDKNNQYILVCRSGNRSKIAAANLTELGYSSVYNLAGGLALTG